MAQFIGSWNVNDTIYFYVNTHDPSTGAAIDADSVPTYRVYKDDSGTAIATGSMSKLDDTNTTGFYYGSFLADSEGSFESGAHQYVIRITATVDSVSGTTTQTFQLGTAALLGTAAISSSSFASGAITASAIASNAITSAKIASGAITSTAFAASAITASAIASSAITSAKFAAGAITSSVLATDCITSDELATTAVNEIRNAITGGAYALDTDANGRIRLVVGTGTGEVSLSSGGIALNSTEDVYHADIQLTVDDSNSQDEYTVIWFLNGTRITSGITSPTIQVIKRSDGTDLVASTPMTEIGTTETYKYDESTNRITLGEAYIVIVGATIDAGSRSFAKVITRDN